MWHDLTSDNLHLSEPKNDLMGSVAIDCRSLPDDVSGYVQGSISESTRKAYRSDIEHFEKWGGVIPSSPEQVAVYLSQHAESLSVSTLKRRLASLSVAHEARGRENPVRTKLVRTTLRGIQRVHGKPQRQVKPLVAEDLFAVLSLLGGRQRDLRDKALLMIGFAGAFRRSELVAIDCSDVERVDQGLLITLQRSKSDQTGKGRRIAIPYGRTRWCPVLALSEWRESACIEGGPLFRSVNRHGSVSKSRLSDKSVSEIVKRHCAAIGRRPRDYSGHSLRAGLATSAAAAGVSSWKIRQQTGHASDAMLSKYVREGELFIDNAVGVLL